MGAPGFREALLAYGRAEAQQGVRPPHEGQTTLRWSDPLSGNPQSTP